MPMPTAEGSKNGGQRQGRSMTELNEDLRAIYDSQPMVTRCGLPGCQWTHEGNAVEGRKAYGIHRVTLHGELPLPPPRMKKPGKAWTREEAEAALRRFFDLHGHPPAHSNLNDVEWLPSAPTLVRLFGGLGAACVALGWERPSSRTNYGQGQPGGTRPSWTAEKVMAAIQAFVAREGRIPLSSEFRKENGLPAVSTLGKARLFGTYTEAVAAAGFAALAEPQTEPEPELEPEEPVLKLEPEPEPEPEVTPEPEPMPDRVRRPRDVNSLAHVIVKKATEAEGQVMEEVEIPNEPESDGEIKADEAPIGVLIVPPRTLPELAERFLAAAQVADAVASLGWNERELLLATLDALREFVEILLPA